MNLVDEDYEHREKPSANDGHLREAVHASAVLTAAPSVENVSAAKRSMMEDGGCFEEAALPSQEPPDPPPPSMFEDGGTVAVKPLTKPEATLPASQAGFRRRRW